MAYAVYLNGGTERVTAYLPTSFNPTYPWALEAWVSVANTDTSGRIHLLGLRTTLATSMSELKLTLDAASRNPIVEFDNGTPATYSTPSVALGSGYEHVRLTWNGTYVGVWLNGTQIINFDLATDHSTAFLADLNQLFVGNGGNGALVAFEGRADDIRLWQTAYVTADYTSPLTGSEPDLVSWYPLDEGSDTVAINNGPNTEDGTIVGSWVTTAPPISTALYTEDTLQYWKVETTSPDASSGTIYETDPLSGTTTPLITEFALLVRGDGSCIEGTFKGKASALQIEPRSVVSFTSVHDAGPLELFKGYVTKNPTENEPEIHEYRMVGLDSRYDEVIVGKNVLVGVETPGFYEGGDLASVALAILADYRAQVLGVNTALDVPSPLGFELGIRIPRYETVKEALDALAESAPELLVSTTSYTYDGITYTNGDLVPAVSWGVRADGSLFFKRAVGSIALNESNPGTRVKWLDIDSEEVVTRTVLVYDVSGDSDDVKTRSGYYKEYEYTTSLVTTREEVHRYDYPITAYEDVEHSVYQATKVIPFSVLANGFASKEATPRTSTVSSGLVVNPDNAFDNDMWTYSNNAESSLATGRTYGWRFREIGESISTGEIEASASNWPIGVEISYSNTSHPRDIETGIQIDAEYRNKATAASGTRYTSHKSFLRKRIAIPESSEQQRTAIVMFTPSVHHNNPVEFDLYIGFSGFFLAGEGDVTRIHELRLLYLDNDRLKDVGQAYIRKPASNPAEITVYKKFVPPAPVVSLVRRNGGTVNVPAASYEYIMDAEDGLRTVISLDQDLDADASAQRSLLNKKNDKTLRKSQRLKE